MKILMLNQNWFAEELRAYGHEVVTCGLSHHHDYTVELPLLHFDVLLKNYPGNFKPDCVIVHDNSAPIVIDGLSDTDCPTIFYSVDAHHHAHLHSYLAHVFDYTYVAQKDYINEFERRGATVEWMPLWASTLVGTSEQKDYDALFVGTLNKELNPERVVFFEGLQKVAPIHVQQGSFPSLFPKAKLIVNQTVKGDLNFRVFEAMSSGVCLLTERSGNGLLELFSEGKELLCYKKNSVEDAAEKIEWAMTHPEQTKEIGAEGKREILLRHTAAHRAEIFEKRIREVKKSESPLKHFAWMANFESLSMRLEKIDSKLAELAMIRTLRAAELALNVGGQITQELAIQFVRACLRHDIMCKSKNGEHLIERAVESIPEEKVLLLAHIRQLLNKGDKAKALQFAAEILPETPSSVFPQAESFARGLVEGDK